MLNGKSARRGVCAGTLSLLIGLLAACGGGGGGASAGGSAPTNPSVTGLVPVAPTLGAVLVADATTLRPLIAGASWSYSGTDTPFAGATPVRYTNTVSQSASGASFTESSSNALNGGADVAVQSASAGTIVSTVVLPLTEIEKKQVSFTELRSPVRQNDQTTVLDQRVTNIGVDVDGDGKNESADIAVYRLVVGMEDVPLPNGAAQRAVRVDMIAIVRPIYSKSGEAGPATQAAMQSTWYAADIGIVKQRLSTFVTATSVAVTEEVLLDYDGVTQGFGFTAAVRARAAANAGSLAGQALQYPRTLLTFADHQVLVSGISSPGYYALSSFDTRGNVTHTYAYPNDSNYGATYLAVDTNIVAVAQPNSGCEIQLTRFDAHGAMQGSSPGSKLTIPPNAKLVAPSLCSTVGQLAAASDGSRIWLAMSRSSLNQSGWVTDLFVQPFDANGKPLAEGTELASANSAGFPTGFAIKSLSAAGGKVLVSYSLEAYGTQYLTSVTDSGQLTKTSFPAEAFGGLPSVNSLSQFATPAGAAVFWIEQLPGGNELGRPYNGLLLDSSLTPQMAAGGSLNAQLLTGGLQSSNGSLLYAQGADGLLVVGRVNTSSGTNSPPSVTLARYNVSAGPLAAQTASTITVPLSDVGESAGNASLLSQPPRVVPFKNYDLLFCESYGGFVFTKIAWRR